MAIIYQTNKKTGITYVIDSQSYWDKEKQQPRSHRTVIGKLDPETGEVIPTKKYNRKKDVPSSPSESIDENAQSTSLDEAVLIERIKDLEQQIAQIREKQESLIRDLNKVLQQHNG